MFPNYSEIESGTKNQYIQSESGEEEMHLGNTIITKANLEHYKSKSITKKIKLAIEDGMPFINMIEVLTIVAFFMIIPGTAISFLLVLGFTGESLIESLIDPYNKDHSHLDYFHRVASHFILAIILFMSFLIFMANLDNSMVLQVTDKIKQNYIIIDNWIWIPVVFLGTLTLLIYHSEKINNEKYKNDKYSEYKLNNKYIIKTIIDGMILNLLLLSISLLLFTPYLTPSDKYLVIRPMEKYEETLYITRLNEDNKPLIKTNTILKTETKDKSSKLPKNLGILSLILIGIYVNQYFKNKRENINQNLC